MDIVWMTQYLPLTDCTTARPWSRLVDCDNVSVVSEASDGRTRQQCAEAAADAWSLGRDRVGLLLMREEVKAMWPGPETTAEARRGTRGGGLLLVLFFFFQAEDGIRDLTVTGVQTCALPIWRPKYIVPSKVVKDRLLLD